MPKDINERKVPLQTPLLSDEIIFEGPRLGWVPLLKLEDWDLANHQKFPYLMTEQLMHHIIDTTIGMTTLEPWKWLRGVDKVGLLNLLWVSHYSLAPITVLVIKQFLCLVHDGCLWLEEPIPIIDKLIHKITWLPYIVENSAMTFGGKGGKHALAEAMKEKFKLVKKLRGYAISSISDPVVEVAMQILAGMVMRKCCAE